MDGPKRVLVFVCCEGIGGQVLHPCFSLVVLLSCRLWFMFWFTFWFSGACGIGVGTWDCNTL